MAQWSRRAAGLALVACAGLALLAAAGAAEGAAADTVAAEPQQQGAESDPAALEQRRAEQAARRREAIRELQEHAAQGYRPGPDVMEGARDGGVLGLAEYVEALLGWDEETWAKVKRVGNYGCAPPPTLITPRCMLGWFGFKRTAADPPVVRSRIASERRRKYVCYTLVALATLGILKSVPFPQDLRPWAAPAFAEYVVCVAACVRFCVRVRFFACGWCGWCCCWCRCCWWWFPSRQRPAQRGGFPVGADEGAGGSRGSEAAGDVGEDERGVATVALCGDQRYAGISARKTQLTGVYTMRGI
jgi:hypothetical protein